MRPRISKKNVNYYLKQQFSFSNTKELFELTTHLPDFRNKVLAHIVKEFTGYTLESNQLKTYNPYTSNYEVLNISNFKHITSTDELFKDLSMLHKTRMEMLTQSRSRLLELSKADNKKYSRDKDLESKIQNEKKND